jgi:hypothetical protein
MTNLDQFESVFKSADKAVYKYDRPTFDRVLLVTDLNKADAAGIADRVRSFLTAIDEADTRWDTLYGDDFGSVQALLENIEKLKPDLIITYRHLHSETWKWPHSLGEYLDVMTQATSVPVMVLPHPDAQRALPHTINDTDRVMAITSHLTGDNQLVNMAVTFTKPSGTCWLTHVENQPVLERYMDAVSKIPGIDTDVAREALGEQLLKEPRDFIAACRVAIDAQGLPIRIEEVVAMGRQVDEYGELIAKREIDLLVLHTKDDDQLAMHGAAYALAVELRGIPLLML